MSFTVREFIQSLSANHIPVEHRVEAIRVFCSSAMASYVNSQDAFQAQRPQNVQIIYKLLHTIAAVQYIYTTCSRTWPEVRAVRDGAPYSYASLSLRSNPKVGLVFAYLSTAAAANANPDVAQFAREALWARLGLSVSPMTLVVHVDDDPNTSPCLDIDLKALPYFGATWIPDYEPVHSPMDVPAIDYSQELEEPVRRRAPKRQRPSRSSSPSSAASASAQEEDEEEDSWPQAPSPRSPDHDRGDLSHSSSTSDLWGLVAAISEDDNVVLAPPVPEIQGDEVRKEGGEDGVDDEDDAALLPPTPKRTKKALRVRFSPDTKKKSTSLATTEPVPQAMLENCYYQALAKNSSARETAVIRESWMVSWDPERASQQLAALEYFIYRNGFKDPRGAIVRFRNDMRARLDREERTRR